MKTVDGMIVPELKEVPDPKNPEKISVKGDTYFTLESLPGVIGWAMDQNKLVVWRHVDGAPGRGYDDDYDDYDD